MTEIRQLKSTEIKPLRNHLLKKQSGICPICGKKIIKPVLDHHHKKKIGGTGQIRKVLCSNCNVFLGKIENNCKRYSISQDELPLVLINTAKYLTSPQLPYIHPSERPPKKILTKSSYNKLAKMHQKSKLRGKLPEYRFNSKGRPIQSYTKPLQKLFESFSIEPEFYK